MHPASASSLALPSTCWFSPRFAGSSPSEIADRHDFANCLRPCIPHSVAPSYRWCILGSISMRRNVLRRGGPSPSSMATESIVSPVGGALYVVHGALRVSEPTYESEPVTVFNYLSTGPARRFHMWLLRGRAMQVPPDVLRPSLCCNPRQIYRSDWHGEPPVESELSCGDPGAYGSLLKRTCRSAEIPDLLENGS